MRSPSVDIIVPVWNSPFETHECLAAIRNHSPEARLIVVDNGSSRETELMLEAFSEPLDDDAIFIKSERNVGLVKAINMGLASSDSDYAVIIRPHVLVTPKWLDGLIDAARFGISTPTFIGNSSPKIPTVSNGVSQMETSGISFAALAIKRELREAIGAFDEQLDGSEWCLSDYVSRAASHGFRVFVCSASKVMHGQEAVFGSEERLAELARISRETCLKRWGAKKHFVVYFGRIADKEKVAECVDTIMKAARLGHRFTFMLHNKQNKLFLRRGWNTLHTSIVIRTVSLLFAKRSLIKQLNKINVSFPGVIAVEGVYGALKQITENVVSFENVEQLLIEQPMNIDTGAE